jgi:hypothetical protein
MYEVNKMLEKYVDVPRSMSLPRVRYNRSPYREQGLDEDGEEIQFIPQSKEEADHMMLPLEKRGIFEYDILEYEEQKMTLEEFLVFRKQF